MRLWIGIVVAFALLAGCGPSRLAMYGTPDFFAISPAPASDAPIRVDTADPIPSAPPADSVWHPPPAAFVPARVRPATLSMGFVGDAPLGPNVSHQQPAWTRPFPSSWTSGYGGMSFRRRR